MYKTVEWLEHSTFGCTAKDGQKGQKAAIPGCSLRLVDTSNNVVYTTIVIGDTLVLLSTLSGGYELQILFGSCYFFGFIGF